MINFSKMTSKITWKVLQIALIVVLAFLFLKQCEATKDAKKEAERNYHNLLAEQDSVRVIESKLGNTIAEKSAFQLKYSELSSEQKELIERFELEVRKKPGVVIQTELLYRDTSITVPVLATQDQNGGILSFQYKPTLPGKNMLSIGGKLDYKIKYDSIIDPSNNGLYKYTQEILPGEAKLSIEQRIDLATALYRDPKTNRLYVRASTTFPGISFSEMQALDMVDDPATRKALKGERKSFGVGVLAGYGMTINQNGYSSGPTIGLGVYYSPKWLQFGK